MKKAQIQMTETIAVLFIFFILVGLGIVFYYKYSQVALKQEQEKLLAERAMEVTLQTLFLPELICSRGEAEPEDNCIDLLKLPYAAVIFEKHLSDYFFNIFSYANITVTQVYPEERTWVLYLKEKTKTSEDGTVSKAWERKEPTFFVVSLRNESANSYGLGYLTVEVYS